MMVHELLSNGKDPDICIRAPYPLTYGQMRTEVSACRHFLSLHGVRAGMNVGLFLGNSIQYLSYFMAVSSLGAVVVPLNVHWTPRETVRVLKDAAIRLLIAREQLEIEEELARQDYAVPIRQILINDSLPKPDGRHSPPPLPITQQESRPCAIVYTSGTTGQPKGVVLTHRNLISNVGSVRAALPTISQDDNVLCVLPMFHCFAWTCSVLLPLAVGASLTLIDAAKPKKILDGIKTFAVSILFAVPPVYHGLLRAGCREDFAGVRVCVSGGMGLPVRLMEQFRERYGIALLEGYGLSEASPVVTLNPYQRPRPGSIGLPLPDVQVRIVDKEDKDVLSGEIGELLATGPNVMSEYFRQPAETALTLKGGWLHTGDLAYQDAEGYVFVVGRLKELIIVNGENVYPQEVEEVLLNCPDVLEAAVVGCPDELHGETVYAFVVMAPESAGDGKALRRQLQQQLSSYKLPREVIRLEALPKNSLGKTQKNLLIALLKTRLAP